MNGHAASAGAGMGGAVNVTVAVKDEGGNLLKILSSGTGELTFGLHQLFGWVTDSACNERLKYQRRNGRSRALRISDDAGWFCKLKLESSRLQALDSCQVQEAAPGLWNVQTPRGALQISQTLSEGAFKSAIAIQTQKDDKALEKGLGVAALLALLFFVGGYLGRGVESQVEPPLMEPVTVKIMPEKQKAVRVVNPAAQVALPKAVQNVDAQAKRAIQQNLGFLGMLGSKNLSKALGGATTQLKASAGAGAGGDAGSGGELLVGLGQGVKRTTVGNSGVAGLGGIGTKGAGGGNGGYGNAAVGSGDGRALSAVAVSQDLVLEGGLDRAVIQATIAKYLSQVRACYEQGLAQQPGINGTVTMNFEVGPSGNLNFSRVAKSTMGHAGVEGCIAQRMMSWKFPKPLGGVAVKVNYPFLLRPIGG